MQRKTFSTAILLFDALFVVYFAAAIYHLTQKPTLPVGIESNVELTIDGVHVTTADESEFIASAHRIGDVVLVGFPGSDTHPVRVQLVPYYSQFLIGVDVFIALVIAGLGVLVHLYRPHETHATIFHLASLTTAAALVGTKTIYAIGPWWLGYVLCVHFFFAYTIIGALFVHFTLVFPAAWRQNLHPLLPWMYASAATIAFASVWMYLRAAHAHSIELFRQSLTVSMVQNGVVFLLLLAGIASFVVSYRHTSIPSEKKKLRWILYGLSIGPMPFVLLWVLPEALGTAPLIPEWIFKLFLLLIPVTFAVSILKYRVMDIDLLINRSAVYAIVVGLGVVCYVGVLVGVAKIVTSLTRETSIIVSTGAAAMLALLFNPARRRVQQFVDRRFFRVQYNFRESLRRFTEELKSCLDVKQIANLLVHRTDELLPVQRIGFFTLKQPGNRIHLVAHQGYELLEARGVRFDMGQLRTQLRQPVALTDQMEPGIMFEAADQDVFCRWGMALVFPMLSEQSDEVIGFLVLGEKKSGMRFTAEDVDLLGAVTVQASLSIQRITLQEKLLFEHAEAQRLDELNKLKSYFVSSVSHDLKTPLTSIKMFAELLRTGSAIPPERTTEYLEIIEGESERLTRLINNVLDFAKIERGVKEYHFAEIDLNDVVERTLCSLQYQFRMEKFTVDVHLCDEICSLTADADALTEALINLLSNAMKYSHERKEIAVSTSLEDGWALVRIADKGIGIAPDDIPHVFEPFYRAKEGKLQEAGGAGLGLAVVKHIIDAHNGKIEIQSEVGAGTEIKLLFPMENKSTISNPKSNIQNLK